MSELTSWQTVLIHGSHTRSVTAIEIPHTLADMCWLFSLDLLDEIYKLNMKLPLLQVKTDSDEIM